MRSRQRLPQSTFESGATETRTIPAWHRERTGRLHRLFIRTEADLQEGNARSLNARLKNFEWRWRGEFYRSDATRRIRFSLHTLRRLFYAWRRGDRKPEALALHYNTPARKPSPSLVMAFLRACVGPDVCIMREGYTALAAKRRTIPFGWPAIWRALEPESRRALRELLRARRQDRSAQRRFARFLARKGRR